MKLKASAIRIALSCVSLLLSLNCSSAQKQPQTASAQTSKSTSAQKAKAEAQTASPTPTPTLQGSYGLIDAARATDTVKNAIEASVKSMPWGTQGLTRGRLQETNLPPPKRIIISYTPTEVSIRTDLAGLIQTPSDGRPIKWTKDGNKYDVSTKWLNGNLERTFKGDDGQRVNSYSLSREGNTLTMKVIGTRSSWPKLKHPLEYQLDYKRN